MITLKLTEDELRQLWNVLPNSVTVNGVDVDRFVTLKNKVAEQFDKLED